MSTGDDFFAGGLPSAKFDVQNKIVGGRVVRVGEKQQQRDMQGNPKFWDGETKSDPMWQLPIDVQTDERDPEVVGDTGLRTIYVKQSGDMKRAIGEAVRRAGVQGAPKVGGVLEVAWTGVEPARTRGFNDKKLYSARYTAPTAADPFFAGGQQANEPGPMQQVENRQRAQSNSAPAADPFASAPVQQPVTVPAGPTTNPFGDDQPPF